MSMNLEKTVLAIVTHPDDAEFLCAGALALLHQRGWQVIMATMTPGDCGSTELDRLAISKIRRQEATEAAAMLDAKYYCHHLLILIDSITYTTDHSEVSESRKINYSFSFHG